MSDERIVNAGPIIAALRRLTRVIDRVADGRFDDGRLLTLVDEGRESVEEIAAALGSPIPVTRPVRTTFDPAPVVHVAFLYREPNKDEVQRVECAIRRASLLSVDVAQLANGQASVDFSFRALLTETQMKHVATYLSKNLKPGRQNVSY